MVTGSFHPAVLTVRPKIAEFPLLPISFLPGVTT